ncbi:glycosyltransferase [Nocardioides campestrisoli]|uniref:glycosyltransferase n=1 Tax=Nocardioides campestrisoli TaxID=2736757 RepID=UPI0015E78282|nr:glycosyltransferase [Nocardioides campestrisoli]
MRNITDLAQHQTEAGYEVGLVCGPIDALHPPRNFDANLFRLGINRVPIRRKPGVGDVAAILQVRRALKAMKPDITHAHGAKGGLYSRIARVGATIYSPHGGVLHYGGVSARPLFFVERQLLRRTDGLVFVAEYEKNSFRDKIAPPGGNARLIYNGLDEDDFVPLPFAQKEYDVAFMGHLRALKGVDVLIDAMRILAEDGHRPRLLIAGPGTRAEVDRYKGLIERLGLSNVTLVPHSVDVRARLASAKLAVMPSLAEALGYFALEVAAVGVPLIATSAGGLPEVFGPTARRLVPPGDPQALANAIAQHLENLDQAESEAKLRQEHVRATFTKRAMFEGTERVYAEALANRRLVPEP